MATNQKISRKNLHTVYNSVCSGWQERISKLLAEQQLNDEIVVPNTLIEQGYIEADAPIKTMLKKFFDLEVFQSIKDKIKTWEDVLKAANTTETDVLPYLNPKTKLQKKLNAIAKITLIAEVLNQGWIADFTIEDYKYYPYFERKKSGWVFVSYLDNRCSLCVSGVAYYKSSDLATYAGQTFLKEYIELFENY